MYYKCCVPGCVSSRQDVLLHKFPKCTKRLRIWVESINCDSLRKERLNNFSALQVCHKHFEPRFVTKKKRLQSIAYPTLFLPSEIISGIPLNPLKCSETVNPLFGHQYAKKVHFDHNYTQQVEEQYSLKELDPLGNIAEQGQPVLHVPTSPETSTETENNIPKEDLFSWQVQSEHIPQDESEQSDDDVPDHLSMYCDDDAPSVIAKEINGKRCHEGFRCDNCNGDIIGYRYTCVQCSDYDLCVACEANGAHDQHYVLRVPAPRPYNEIQSVLASIRRYLMKELDPISAADSDKEDAISVKSEVKSENEEQEEFEVEKHKVITFDEDSVTHELKQDDYTHSSPESVCLENADSKVVSQNNMPIQQQVKIFNTNLKQDRNRSPQFLKSLDTSKSTIPSTAKRKIVLKTSDFLKITESYQQTKKICIMSSTSTQETKKAPKNCLEANTGNPKVILKLPLDPLLNQEPDSLQHRSPRKPQIIGTDDGNS